VQQLEPERLFWSENKAIVVYGLQLGFRKWRGIKPENCLGMLGSDLGEMTPCTFARPKSDDFACGQSCVFYGRNVIVINKTIAQAHYSRQWTTLFQMASVGMKRVTMIVKK
jgi:hypothetical protein